MVYMKFIEEKEKGLSKVKIQGKRIVIWYLTFFQFML